LEKDTEIYERESKTIKIKYIMPDNYILDGDNYSQEDVLAAAEAKGLTIEEYINEYYPDDSLGKIDDFSIETQTTESNVMDSGSGDGSSGSVQDRTVQPNIVIPEIIGDTPNLTMEDITMTDVERAEFDRKAEEQRQKGIEGQKLYLREKQIKDKTGLLPSNYPMLQVGGGYMGDTEAQSHMGQVVDVPVEDPIYEQVDLEKMEEITANVTSEYRNVFNSLISDELETLQNYAEDPMTYENELNETHDQVFAVMREKYPGLDKRAFMDIVGKGGDGLFQTALNKVTTEDKERDNAENLLGATTLDEDVYKQIFNQTSQNFSEKELKKQGLNTLIRKKNRDLIRLQEEGGDANEIKRLTSEIKTHKNDIQKLATTKTTTSAGQGGLGAYTKQVEVVDKKLASSYMDNETTEYRQGKIDKAKKDLDGTLLTQVQEQKIKNPKLTDFEAHELLYKSKAYNLQQLWATGNTETVNLKFNGGSAPDLYKKLIESGHISKEQQKNYTKLDLNVPIKTLFDAGYDGRDFKGLSNTLGYMVDIKEDDRKKLLNYESSIYRNKGELELLHELTYVNNDPATFDRGGFVGEVARAGLSATLTHFTDINPVEADKLASLGPGATESKMLEEFEKLGNTYNETFKNEIAKGEIDELGFTPDQLKAIERTFGEEIGEGFGHFVPMLIELGIISAATGATMTATGASRVLAGMRNAGGWKKTQYHAIMTMIEEGKMFTAGFDPGAGAGFYAGGQLTSGVTPFKKRFKWMDPLFQKVVKGGPVGATSAQIAFNLETGIQDLLGNKDFQATFDKHYGDLTFKDVIVESIVFSIAGATHAKKTDFMSTRRKYDAMTELKDKMNELIEKPTGELGKEGVGRALETAFTTDAEGNIVRTRPEGYEMMSKEQQTKWEALNEAYKNLDQMTKVETTAIELDPNNKDFESNVDKMFTQPINETLKSVNKEFEGFKVEFTENAKDARFPEGADGAAFMPGKGKDPGTALFLKSKFTPEKMTHEVLGHAGLESYFNRNPQAEVKFKKNIGKLFEKFDFEAYDGTPLGEFIKKNYSKEIGKGNNIEPREFFAYMFELLTDPKIYYQKVAPTFFKEAKQELLSVLEESTGMKPKIRTARQFVDYIGRLSMDARRGLNIQAKVARLGDLDDISFLGIEFVENNKKRTEAQAMGSKDLKGDKAKLVEQNIELGKSKPEGWREKMDKNVIKIKNLNKNIEISESNAKEIAKYKEREAKGIDPSIQFEKLRENNIGILNEFVNKNYKDVPGSDLTKAEFKNYVENNEFLKIINSYNMDSGVPFGAYLKQNIRPRTGNILKALGVDMESKIKTVSLDAPEAMQLETGTATERAQEAGGTKGIELVYELPVKQKSIDAIKNKIESLDLEKLDYKTLKDQAPEATKEMFGKSNANKAKFITDNWKTIYDLLPQNTSQVTGKATGIENSILKDFYKKGDRVKMAKTGSKQGAFIQEKIPMTKTEFLNKLGIREKLDGSVDISSMNRNIKTSTIPAIINQTGKAITNQIVRRGLKENPSYNFKVNAETLANQIGSGRSEALASKLIKNFSDKFDIPLEKTQDILLNYAIGNKSLVEKKYRDFLDKFKDNEFFSDPRQAALWSAVEVEGLKGKTTATKFMGDFNTYWDNFKGKLPDGITVKDMKALKPKAFYTESKGNVVVEVERLNKHVDLSVEFAKMLPKSFEKSLTFFDQLVGLHQRVTMEKEGRYAKFEPATDAITGKKVREIEGDFKGFIMDSRDGSPIINQPFTRGRERALENLGKNVSDLWKGIEIKFKSASTQEKGQKELAKAGGDFKKQLEIAEKYFTELDNKTKEDIYFAIEATKQEFIEAGKNKQEKLNRTEWVYNVARSNTNLRMGVRQTVPVKYVLFPEGKITGEKIKLEHLKAMVTQSIQTANLVASGTFKKAGKEATSDFLGITSTKDLLDIVDKEGGLTNTSGLYRMSLLNPDILSQYKSVESGFKRTLLQDIQMKFEKEVGPKKFKELQKANKGVEKRMTEQLAEVGFSSKDLTRGEKERRIRIIDNAIKSGRDKKKKARGMSTFDFDETVGISENYVIATKGKEKKRIASAEWPFVGEKLINEGWKMDFTDFNKVTKGKPGPLMQKMKNQIEKFGPENVFILTARAKESAQAIHEWLKSEGVNIPLKNITGLGNSTGEAKAMWMLEKFSEGYNDMYFVDDALPNVKAVKNVLDQLDIKSKVQQALASKDLGKGVNDIMEHSLDIGSKKVFSKAEAKVRGKDIKRRRVLMTDSAADLELLIEPLYGKGKKGIENKKWFKKEFVMPFERGIRDYNTARQSAKNDYMNLRKQNKDVVKEISKEVEGTTFTNDMAMRVYLWNKAGYKIPDLAKTTETKLVEHIKNNPKLQAYAEQFARITKQEKGLKEPGQNWWAETMAGEVTNINRGVSRKQYLQEWIDVKNEIFTTENLNKMESKLGTRWRENIEDMFDRMETGRTRSLKMDRGSAIMMNYLNGGIGTIMNFNTRSAVLQTISTTNFLNMRENNPIAAARAMGNVKQFAKDFKFIMNSDMLKQRRDGLAINVTEAEIASAAASSQNPIQSIIAKVLKAGYLPTKMADSFAISLGGATFYRNRIKMYEKQGMKTKEAEKQAWLDFQWIAERTQQSSRADLLSRQQTSLVGRFLLPFANTPMQMNRLGIKEILDLSKGRYKDAIEATEKVGKISYYMGLQVAVFAGLQSALFAMLLSDDDVSDEKLANTKAYALQTTADSMLRGFGIQGAAISSFKNAILEYFKQSSKPGFTADYGEVAEDLLNISPPIGSKFGMLDAAGEKKKWAKIKKNDEFKFELGNPSLEASLMTIQATTNAPVYSPYQNIINLQHAMSDQYEAWQRVLMGAGWTPYNVGIETEKKKDKKKKKKKIIRKGGTLTF